MHRIHVVHCVMTNHSPALLCCLQASLNCRSDLPLPGPLNRPQGDNTTGRILGGRELLQTQPRRATGLKKPANALQTSRLRMTGVSETEPPPDMDWRNYVPAIQNQGQVSATCWLERL